MNRTALNKAWQQLLHLLTALLAGVLATALLEVGLWMALFHFFPSKSDDLGFGGAGVLALLIFTAYVGILLFSAIAYWLLRNRFAHSSKSDR